MKQNDNLRSQSVMFNGKSSYDHDYHRHNNFKQDKDSFAPHETYQATHGLRPKSTNVC